MSLILIDNQQDTHCSLQHSLVNHENKNRNDVENSTNFKLFVNLFIILDNYFAGRKQSTNIPDSFLSTNIIAFEDIKGW